MRKGIDSTERALLARMIAAWPNPGDRVRALAVVDREHVAPPSIGGNDRCQHGDLIHHVSGAIQCGRCGKEWAR